MKKVILKDRVLFICFDDINEEFYYRTSTTIFEKGFKTLTEVKKDIIDKYGSIIRMYDL